jgi:AcrR family transcriptional regulator
VGVSVKREYGSELRAAQARQTRRAIVAAAALLFVRDGYGRTTIDAIAEAAGVSRKTVFASAGGKADLMKLALDWATVGDDDPVPLAKRPSVHDIGQLTDPDAILAGYVSVIVDIDRRTAELSEALVVAAGIDEQARALREQAVAGRLAGARAFVKHLANHGGLAADLDQGAAADIAWVHSDPALYRWLVLERRWSRQRFSTWLQRTLTQQLRGEERS